MQSNLISIGIVLLASYSALAQNRISLTGAARAKMEMRVVQNASEAKLIDGEFDPFTQGSLQGLQENLEEEMETGPVGDRRIARMIYTNLSWLIAYRFDHHPEPLRTEIMQWHFDCTHDINVALRRGVVPRHNGACEFTESKYEKLHARDLNKLNNRPGTASPE